MTQTLSLTNQLLIAMPIMQDPMFRKSVIYVCEHNEYGAIGLIINRPMEYNLQFVFEQMKIEITVPEAGLLPLLFGGPVQQERGFVIHKHAGAWRSSLKISDDLTITTSHDILNALATGEGPQQVLVILGYAGWEAAQLELEVTQNTWLTCPALPKILFDTPFEERWSAAAASIGVDINTLSTDAGHG